MSYGLPISLPLRFLVALLFLAQLGKGAFRICHKPLRRVVLDQLTLAQQHDAVGVDDRVEAVRNSQDCGINELFVDQLLDGPLRDDVDVGGGFVEHHELASSEDSPNDAD